MKNNVEKILFKGRSCLTWKIFDKYADKTFISDE